MNKLIISPVQQGYSVDRGEEMISVDYRGGATGIRRGVPGAPAILAAQWIVTAALFNYLLAFYRYATRHGALPFTVDLLADSSTVEETVARIVPGSFRIAGKQGDAYMIEAQLEIELARAVAVDDAATVEAYVP